MNLLVRNMRVKMALNPSLLMSRCTMYPNLKFRNTKIRSKKTKSELREERKRTMENKYDPETSGEPIPEFFTPARTRLYFKVLQEMRNSSIVTRKPMPKKVKEKFVNMCKEYNEFKAAEEMYMQMERDRQDVSHKIKLF